MDRSDCIFWNKQRVLLCQKIEEQFKCDYQPDVTFTSQLIRRVSQENIPPDFGQMQELFLAIGLRQRRSRFRNHLVWHFRYPKAMAKTFLLVFVQRICTSLLESVHMWRPYGYDKIWGQSIPLRKQSNNPFSKCRITCMTLPISATQILHQNL